MNTCIHRHKHKSSNTILVKNNNKHLSSNPSGATEFIPFRSSWVHILPEHLSSHPPGALEFTFFRSTWVHIRFLVVFVFLFIGLFFYVVFCRSLFVPLFIFLLNIVLCRPSSIYGYWFPLWYLQTFPMSSWC
jgi:hypothetical protein